MKIVILGKGKSGTTVLVHMIAAAFPECRPVLGGFRAHVRARAREAGECDAGFVCKFTYNDKKGRSFDTVMQHIEEEGYDQKIWVTRDPRDNAVSDALFRWRGRHRKSERQFRACLSLVQGKERDPRAIPFWEIYRHSGDPGGPDSFERLVEMERIRYARMLEFVRNLGGDWYIFRYEDLVNGNLAGLSARLGREVRVPSEMPREDQVKARTKSYGDWRNWFLDEDVRAFAPIYTPYMDLVGYDSADWRLAPEPRIDPAVASQYMQRLWLDGRPRGLPRLAMHVGHAYAFAASRMGREPR